MTVKSEIKIELATKNLRSLALAVREKVFVRELGVPKSKEFDDNDDVAAHIIAYKTQNNRKLPIGTMRIRFFKDFVKFERMSVLRNYRKTTVASDIMEFGFNYVAEKGYTQVYGMCKKELLPRWQKCGYQPISGVKPIEQNDMILIPIIRHLPENQKSISINSAPELLIKQEGHWFDSNPSMAEKLLQLKIAVKNR